MTGIQQCRDVGLRSEGCILGHIAAVEAIDTKYRDVLVVFTADFLVPRQTTDDGAEQGGQEGVPEMHNRSRSA